MPQRSAGAVVRSIGSWLHILKGTIEESATDESPLHAAAIAFFTLFAVVPLIALVLLVAHLAFGDGEGARQAMLRGVESMLGEEQMDALQEVIANTRTPGGSWWTVAAAAVILLFAASRVFAALEVSLDRIWDVETQHPPWLEALRRRFFSLAMVLGVLFLLLASLLLSSALSAGARLMADLLPWDHVTIQVGLSVMSVVLLAPVFMLLFKYMPHADIRWADVAPGGLVTAVLFTGGQLLIGRVIAGASLANAFGAFASLIIVLLWMYYMALIFLFGAEFTQVYARARGHPVQPQTGVARRRGEKRRQTGS